MRIVRPSTLLFAFVLSLLACSGPGPLAPGDSRIKVQCTGFALGGIPVYVVDATTQQRVGAQQSLLCVFQRDVYFDVPVPPYGYGVMTDGGRLGGVVFGGPGEQQTIKIVKIFVTYSVST